MRSSHRYRQRGFTLIEMMVASFLMVLMAVLLANTWVVFGRSALSAVARVRIAQEANLAAAALAKDFGQLSRPLDIGLVARPPNMYTDSRYLNVVPIIGGIQFLIDDGTGTIRTIQYAPDSIDNSKLVRTDLSAGPGSGRVVATLLSGFQAQAGQTLPNSSISGTQIDLTFTHRTNDRNPDKTFRGDHTRRFTIFVPDSQP